MAFFRKFITEIWPFIDFAVFAQYFKLKYIENKLELECTVDGVPSQIPMLKFLIHPAPQVPPLGHDPSNRVKILFNMFTIFYL